MKKCKSSTLLAILMIAALLTACGSKEYLKDVKASKYVTLGEYKGVAVEVNAVKVEDSEVESAMNLILSSRATTQEVTDRAIQDGDIASIDYTGYKDGVAFEGGTGSTDLGIGTDTFIDGFEDGLIGHNAGEHVSLNLKFPENYTNEELAGQDVVFEVDIKAVSEKILPELNDEFVKSLETENVSTVDEFRSHIKDLLMQDAQTVYDNELKATMTETVMKGCTFKELPEEFVNRYYTTLTTSLTSQATAQGITLEQYMSYYYGTTDYTTAIQENAKTTAQQYMMFGAIADAENISISEQEYKDEVAERVEEYGYESAEKFEESMDMETFREMMLANKVMDYLIENAQITEK